MITRTGVTLVLRGWRALERRRAAGCSVLRGNLRLQPGPCLQSLNRRMCAASLPLPEANVKKFLDYLIKAYADGTTTEFDALLEYPPVRSLMEERLKIIENIESLEELREDKEMKKLVEEERCANENQLKQVDSELIDLILKNLAIKSYDEVILEISAGVGGQEAMLFVKDLMEMYVNHLSYLGYNFKIVDVSDAALGGIKHVSLMVSGKGAFEKLRHEAGNHRVQRVPATEKSGRMHTSVVSVAVLPQPSEIDVKINSNDLRIDTMRASGAGGQHVNVTDSAVRVVHLPTGIMAECQTERSQFKNRETALAKLRTKLYQIELDKQMKSSSSLRKQQMGLGQRNEKIRTYNFNQDRVTDHRLSNGGTLHNLKGFLGGGQALDGLHLKLEEDLRHKILLEAVNDIK